MNEAWAHEPEDANAMTLATATPDGMPAARIVLLKGADARGFVFYTNTESRKGEELAANARAALLFHWKPLGRQVRIEGRVEHVTDAEADAYYATRAAHLAARRLGVGPVARAAGPRGAGAAPRGPTRRSIPARTSRARPTGPASASSPSASSSGRTCRSGCTTARSTRRRRTAAGRSASCSPDPTMTAPPEQAEVVAFLRGLAGSEPLETHISLVFVGADTVWKLKKAVRLAFLDFTRWRHAGTSRMRELELNRVGGARPVSRRRAGGAPRGRHAGLWRRAATGRRSTGCCAWRACPPAISSMPSRRPAV